MAHLVSTAVAALLITTAPVYAYAAEIVHIVARGQTLGRIAKRYHIGVATLREVNNLKPGQPIHPGLALVVPEKGKEAEALKKAEKLRKGEASAKGSAKAGDVKANGAQGAATRKDEAGYARAPKRPGFVEMTRPPDTFRGQVLTRHGRLVPGSLTGLSRVLRYYPTDEKIPIDPRLATLIGMVSDHFGGRPLRVTSGYRPYSPAQYAPHSNHNLGRAVDFAVDGVPNTVVRDFCRTFRNAGVGFYPNGSFVHLDVRAAKMYWVDTSRAGEAPRYETPGMAHDADDAGSEIEPRPSAVDDASPGADDAAGSDTTHPGAPQATDQENRAQ